MGATKRIWENEQEWRVMMDERGKQIGWFPENDVSRKQAAAREEFGRHMDRLWWEEKGDFSEDALKEHFTRIESSPQLKSFGKFADRLILGRPSMESWYNEQMQKQGERIHFGFEDFLFSGSDLVCARKTEEEVAAKIPANVTHLDWRLMYVDWMYDQLHGEDIWDAKFRNIQ
jgi:hypothetical protein